MSARANPFRIGAFVAGAVLLIIAGLLAFGSRDLFVENKRYITFFRGSVAGLRLGAPVTFRGVPVGEVVDVRLIYDSSSEETLLPVTFETFPDAIEVVDPKGFAPEADVQRLIELGLRAQLAPVSLVTGQLSVELAFHSDTEAEMVGGSQPYPEIPTVPTKFELLESQLQAFLGSASAEGGIDGLLNSLNDVLSEENRRHVGDILGSLAGISASVEDHADDVADLIHNTGNLLNETNSTVVDLRRLITTAESNMNALSEALASREEDLARSIDNFDATVQSVGRMADQVNNAIAENRPGVRDFSENTLYAVDGLVLDFEQLAQKLNRIADTIERDSSAFFFGNQARQGVQAP